MSPFVDIVYFTPRFSVVSITRSWNSAAGPRFAPAKVTVADVNAFTLKLTVDVPAFHFAEFVVTESVHTVLAAPPVRFHTVDPSCIYQFALVVWLMTSAPIDQ